MPKKRFGAEQIVTLLRQIEVSMAQGKSVPEACRAAEISQQLRDELLNGEIFYSLKEGRLLSSNGGTTTTLSGRTHRSDIDHQRHRR
jgi:hypothetical protein